MDEKPGTVGITRQGRSCQKGNSRPKPVKTDMGKSEKNSDGRQRKKQRDPVARRRTARGGIPDGKKEKENRATDNSGIGDLRPEKLERNRRRGVFKGRGKRPMGDRPQQEEEIYPPPAQPPSANAPEKPRSQDARRQQDKTIGMAVVGRKEIVHETILIDPAHNTKEHLSGNMGPCRDMKNGSSVPVEQPSALYLLDTLRKPDKRLLQGMRRSFLISPNLLHVAFTLTRSPCFTSGSPIDTCPASFPAWA